MSTLTTTLCQDEIAISFVATPAPATMTVRRHSGTVTGGAVTVPILAAALPNNRNLIQVYVNRQRYFSGEDFTVTGQTITFSLNVAPTIEGRTAKIEVLGTL